MTTEIVLVRRIVAIDAHGEPVFKEMPEVRLIEETEAVSQFTDRIDDVRRLELRNIVGQNIVHRALSVDWTGVEAAAMAADLGFISVNGEVIDGLQHYLADSLDSGHTNYPHILSLLEAAGRGRAGEGCSTEDLRIDLNVEVTEADIADGIQENCSLCAFALALQRAAGDDNHVHVTGTMAYLNGVHHCWLPNEVKTFIDLFDRNPDTGDFVKPIQAHVVFLKTEEATIPEPCRESADTFHNDAEPLWSYWIETDEGVKSGEIRAKTLHFARGILKSSFPEDWGADGELTSPGNHSFPVWREES